jgi:putative alpha-1,2-mannosidase
MTGAHSFVILADAAAKGIPYNMTEALAVMVNEASSASSRRGYELVSSYMTLGYLPVDLLDHGCSSTLECGTVVSGCFNHSNMICMYAYDDWALSVVAAAAGEVELHRTFVARSKNYK